MAKKPKFFFQAINSQNETKKMSIAKLNSAQSDTKFEKIQKNLNSTLGTCECK